MEGARQRGQLGGWRGGNAWGSDSGIPRLLVKIGKWIPGGRLEGLDAEERMDHRLFIIVIINPISC